LTDRLLIGSTEGKLILRQLQPETKDMQLQTKKSKKQLQPKNQKCNSKTAVAAKHKQTNATQGYSAVQPLPQPNLKSDNAVEAPESSKCPNAALAQ
jgi:hypothetical protein